MTATFFPVARSSPYEAFRGAPALGQPPANPVRLVNPVLGSGPVSPSRASRLPVYPAVPIDTSVKGSVRIPFRGFTGEDSIGSIFADYPTSPFYGSSSGRFSSNG